MQKNQLPGRGAGMSLLSLKVLMFMKLTVMLTLLACLSVSAATYSQDAKVSLKLNGASVQQLFNAIEKKTSYRFVFSNDIIPRNLRVSIDVQNTAVAEVLSHALDRSNLDFRMLENDMIVVADRSSIRQMARVEGRVLDAAGDPLEGVSITIKGSAGGTFSGVKGTFALNVPNPHSELVFSYVGLETLIVPLNGRKTLEVMMKGARQLSTVTVVNTGFQQLNKERATGSFGYIDKEQLGRPTTNIASRIIGTTAGVQAKLDVDGNPTFEIRGKSSLYAAAAPLVVVDGFPISGDFNTINPNDVESVTILKDAAAASIWGARSANGVIVVATKKGQKGTPLRVDFSAFTKMGSKFDLDYVNPLASSAETVDYETRSFNKWSARTNPGTISNAGMAWSSATIALNEAYLGYMTAAEKDAVLAKLSTQSNKGQIRDLLLATPATQQYNLSLSGSNGRMSNMLSFLFEDNQSNFKETGYQKYLLNFRTTANITRWLDFNFGGMMHYNKAENSGLSLGDIQGLSPYEMLKNPDGSLTNIHQYYTPILTRLVPTARFPYSDWSYNPVQEIANRDLRTTQLNGRIMGGLTLKLVKGLTLDSKFQYELFNTFNRGLYNDRTFYVRNLVNTATSWNQATGVLTPNLPKGSILTQSRSRTQAYNLRNAISYNNFFARKHEVNFIAGAEISNQVTEVFGNPTTYGYNDETLTSGIFPNGPGGTFRTIQNWQGSNQTFAYSNSFAYTTNRYFSSFANLAYTYNGKYTASGSFRTDASNIIADDPKYRYSPFWSAGLAWQLHREDFLRAATYLNRLNLRMTYGYNGNEDRSTSFMPLISVGATPNVYTNDYTATIASFGNPTLRWEKTATWNVGLDYSLFGNQLFGKVDVYSKYGKDQIAQLTIPAANGTTSQKLNNAEISNRGVELEIGTQQSITKRISWQGNLNFSFNRNRIEKLFVANYAASTLVGGGSGAYVQGANANDLWRFRYAGLQNGQPMLYGEKGQLYNFGAFTPGDGRNYLENMGTTVAPYTLGFMNTFRVYDFDLSFILTGKFGHVFQRRGFNYPPTWTSRVLPNNKLSEVLNGDPQKIVPLPQNDVEDRYYFWDRFHQYMTYLIESASHVRMQEVNLTYNLNKATLSRLHLQHVQLFAQGNNLFTIYANDAKEDPEYPLGTMRPQPTVTLGLKVSL
ncbi:SusC/RagA family TonB-linked outer membrane protein [Chitinophaga horti]|uniref:SusC/RagA family TonB-linked outer membrane protein n=1 Tax=Chitinophaga horti TaxID=2920382 RepID=A0ABY6J7L3_9BACT|nr:SusC/RagA family TonB-linked outer membrane protein [Chitinophaga horti]UYQ95678.1 SusC/RagA family TonB-linked outer membrane protein [Chitinophaga horti]